jgi:hypothetical protein
MLYRVGGQTIACFLKYGTAFFRTTKQSANNGVDPEN